MAYPNLSKDPELLKIKTKDDQLRELQYKTEKHDLENISKSLKIDNDYYEWKYKSLNQKEVLLNITEFLLGSGFAKITSTMSLTNPTIGIVIIKSTALLTSIALLITNE